MNKKLSIEHISKVEGHGKLYVDIKNGEVKCVQMEITEGARFFEALVKDRNFADVPHITSRICGICSQSHLLCAIIALERALKVRPTKQTQQLRELMMLASLIQSHVLHLFFLALPDYLGYDNAIAMAKRYKKEVELALRLKRFANEIVTTIGGRDIHSITPVVGGFVSLPRKDELKSLQKKLREYKKDFEKAISLFCGLKYPPFSRDTQYLAMRDKNKVNYLQGDLLSSSKLKFTQQKYLKFIKEKVVPYSNTKCVTLKKAEYMVGALARLNVNKTIISRNAKKLLSKSKVNFPSSNPYHNNAAQAIELMDFYDKAMSILNQLKLKDEAPVKYKIRAGSGIAAVEAPRGLLFHEYDLSSKGDVKKANIIAPTTQNLKNIEEDIKELLPQLLKKTKSEKVILNECEKLIRAYDPCISCSTHFLEIIWNRS